MSKRPQWWLTVLAKVWPLTWISAKATTWPLLGPLIAKMTLPLFRGKNLDITYIPINEEIDGVQSTVLPKSIVEELIKRSAHRVIIKRCTCRDARGCEEHPIDYGCTLLGEGTKEIDERIADHVTVDEAIGHFHKTLEDGLIPMTGRVKIDNLIWGVKDRGKLLTVCHCCRCCCTILASGKYLPGAAQKSIVRLQGLTVEVDYDTCTGCMACIEECFMGAITIQNGKIIHNDSLCKGCGRCENVCKQNAVALNLGSLPIAMDEIIDRIKGKIDFE